MRCVERAFCSCRRASSAVTLSVSTVEASRSCAVVTAWACPCPSCLGWQCGWDLSTQHGTVQRRVPVRALCRRWMVWRSSSCCTRSTSFSALRCRRAWRSSSMAKWAALSACGGRVVDDAQMVVVWLLYKYLLELLNLLCSRGAFPS